MGILEHVSAVEELKFGMSSCIRIVPIFQFIPEDTEGLDLSVPTCLHPFQSHR